MSKLSFIFSRLYWRGLKVLTQFAMWHTLPSSYDQTGVCTMFQVSTMLPLGCRGGGASFYKLEFSVLNNRGACADITVYGVGFEMES